MRTVAMLLAMLVAPAALAQPPFKVQFTPVATPAEPDAIPLGTGSVADMPPESWFKDHDLRAVRNVSRATLTPVLPARGGNPSRAAVIVLPGGGFRMVSMENEGWPVARWFADRGIAAFVLKYRLLPSPASQADFQAEIEAAIREAMLGSRPPALETPPQALADALAALRYVRAHGSQWNIEPSRVGTVGFSAGAITELSLVRAVPAGEQPAFIGVIYGPMEAIEVPAQAPPLFAALAADDPLFGKQGFGLVEGWLRAGRQAELHVYQRGGHGFGMGAPDTTSGDWRYAFAHWLAVNGWLKTSP